MQCKDIPDRPILELLAKNPKKWHNWNWCDELDVRKAMPEDAPTKLCHAKMKRLIQRKLVDGCGCGCRGDFVITELGLSQLYSV